MRKYVNDYIKSIDKILEQKTIDNPEEIKKEHLIKIQFIQHERLIHFLVTFMFAIILFICIAIMMLIKSPSILLLITLVLGLLVPYIIHYYFLENSVQKMYRQYDRICEMSYD